MYAQSPLSTEYVRVAISATDGSSAINPTSDAVQIAFVSPGAQPDVGDWLSADWETSSGVYYARVLVGPDGGVTTLGIGLYDVYVKVEDNPETPVRRFGAVAIL